MTLAGIGSTMVADLLANRLGRVPTRQALMIAVALAWTLASIALAASPNWIWFWVRSRGSILAMRAPNADKQACGVGIYPVHALVSDGRLRKFTSWDSALRCWRRRNPARSRRLQLRD